MMPVRTNSDVEGWRNSFHASGRFHMQFYLLVNLLHQEGKLAALHIHLVSERKLRNVQARIFTLWDQYNNGSKSSTELLQACARLNGPTQ